jgi:predicted amidophosphoribosyltransferase
MAESNACFYCGAEQNYLNCKRCASDFEVQRFFCYSDYKLFKSFIVSRKSGADRYDRKLPWLSQTVSNYLMEETNVDLVFVPSRSKEHWLQHFISDDSILSLRNLIEKKDGRISSKLLSSNARKNTPDGFQLVKKNLNVIGDSVLLVDDVASTGSSLRACISLLKRLGYPNIFVFVFTGQKLR